jgi:N-dimethylarginine dimethylaminohydrolase
LFDPDSIPDRKEPLHALMCSPNHFKIVDVKNVHMEGNAGKVDPVIFKQQWKSIFDIYQQEANARNIAAITEIEGIKGCEDMVFCANQSFPWIDKKGKPMVIMSRMRYPSRQLEVPYFEMYYEHHGYAIIPPPGEGLLEGMGDLIPVPGKRIIFGGYGHRTDLSTLKSVSEILETEIIPLELINDAFYHLDTCFIPLDMQTALIAPEAFNQEGLKILKSFFSELIEIPYNESAKGFALNAHIVHGAKYKFAIIQKDNPFTQEVLEKKGFNVHEVDTSEFMKSGGSVFCMKMMHY